MPQLLRLNPGLVIWLAIFGIATVVVLVLALTMNRSGASIRPILWFAGFLLVVGGPQFVAHLVLALEAAKRDAPRAAALHTLAGEAPRETRQPAARLLLGPDADADLILDARALFGDALAGADVARFASLPTGESVMLARFPGFSAAQRAWVLYLRHTGLNQLGGTGDSERGYAVTRPGGDRAYVAQLDNLLAVWTGPDDATIRRRMAAGGFQPPRRAPLAVAPSTSVTLPAESTPGLASLGRRLLDTVAGRVVLAAGLAVYLGLVVFYFFKGVSWAGSVAARPGVTPAPAAELIARLESINPLDVPFRIERGTEPGELVCTWRYADARWFDTARLHRLRRIHRLRLRLDETGRFVQATDYSASYDASAGAGGATIQWKAASGVVLFQREYQQVFGLQLGTDGKFQPNLTYSYTFDVREMKAPLIEAVTRAGWSWRPAVWADPPRWLRWLVA